MADMYTVKKVQGGTWQIVRIDNDKVVRRGLTAEKALQDCQQLNDDARK